jgi:Flp pilus assembly protein TadD
MGEREQPVPAAVLPVMTSFSTAVAAFRSGQLREAEQACRDVLAIEPRNPDAFNLLGVIAGTVGNHAGAAEFMQRSVELAPDVVEFRVNLAKALMHEGKLADAEEVLRRVVTRNPESPTLLGLWGAVVGQQGRIDEGIEALKKASKRAPQDASHHFNLAELYRRKGDRETAVSQLKKSLQIAPNYADALNNLAGLQLASGDFLDALGTIQRLLAINPRSAQAYCNLGMLLAAGGDSHSGEIALRNAIALAPKMPRARFHLANQLITVGKLDEAEALIRELRCSEDSDRNSLKLTHVRILERKGDIPGAAAILESIPEKDRLHPEVALMYAVVLEQQGKAEEALAILHEALKSDELQALEGIGIHFTLGDLYDSLGRFDEAFEAYRLGNTNRKKAFFKFDRPTEPGATTADRLIRLYEPAHYRQLPTSTLDSEVPIFIIGMPRSGTSLTEQILASHSQVYGAGELTTFRDVVRNTYSSPGENKPWSPLEIIDTDPSVDQQCMVPKNWDSITAGQLSDIGSQYLETIRSLDGQAQRISDKMPYNYFLAPLIAKVFPRGRIIHCRRHPLDTCLSCYFQNFTGGSEFSFDLRDLGDFYRNYLKLMAHWRDTLQVPMLDVNYEQLVNDPEPGVRAILEFCGLEWEPECLKFHKSKRAINTASYQQVRKPIYTRSAGRWKNYEKHLAPLVDALRIDPNEWE